jgi:hypothetical protein
MIWDIISKKIKLPLYSLYPDLVFKRLFLLQTRLCDIYYSHEKRSGFFNCMDYFAWGYILGQIDNTKHIVTIPDMFDQYLG